MLRRILLSTRHLIVLAVIATLLTSATVLAYSLLVSLRLIWDLVAAAEVSADGGERLALVAIEVVDLALLGTVGLLVALGLYELFIDPTIPLPDWLHIETLDDLKAKLLGIVMVLLGVLFLSAVVKWEGDDSILQLGLAVGAVLAAFALLTGLPGLRGRGDR